MVGLLQALGTSLFVYGTRQQVTRPPVSKTSKVQFLHCWHCLMAGWLQPALTRQFDYGIQRPVSKPHALASRRAPWHCSPTVGSLRVLGRTLSDCGISHPTSNWLALSD